MPLPILVLTLATGFALWVGSLLIASAANRGIRMPYWTNPPRNRPLAIAVRALGSALLVLGASWLAVVVDPWWMALALFAPLIGIPLLIIPLHNRRVAARAAANASA
ncbi:hypothetical protein AB1K54_15735 [Microbacterium sp. BWT-B31]|uniref:hypothetical protein n=1 Tax=Microbacterium sp. BWT-B31 TaxID=3232072 RepID=UPI003527A28E